MVHRTPRRSDITRLPADGSASPTEVARIVNALIDNHHEAHGALEVLAGTTSTVVRVPIFSAHTILTLTPVSAAAADLRIWQDEVQTDKRAITLRHDAPTENLEFWWVASG